ncbi:unnamed protein product [Rhodiola kirilowii]
MGKEGYVVPAEPQAVGKKKTASRSWILIDSTGQGTVLDVDKYAVMHRVHIHARDLRILDPLLSYPSTILGRDKAIVLNLEHIKAIITGEEVFLRDPFDENVVPVVEELKRRLQPANYLRQGNEHDIEIMEEDESPFEFRALEVALEAICSFLAARTTELETAAYPALDELTSKISSRNLDRVRKLKSAMTRLTARVQKVRDELEQLLDDDDDMNDLYLTRKLMVSSPISASGGANWYPASPTMGSRISKASRASAYFMQIDGTYNKLTTQIHPLVVPPCFFLQYPVCNFYVNTQFKLILLQLREYIDDTEDYINIQLDNKRNQLIQLELFVSAGTVCLSIYSLVAGIFGMNIPYTWNDNHSDMFIWVVCVSGVSCLLLFLLIISYARHKGLVGS